MLTATADGLLHDGGRVFGPDERGRMAVPVGDVSLDVANQRTDGIERAAPDRLTRQNAEPGFDHVEPGRALGREVKFDVGMLRERSLVPRGSRHHSVMPLGQLSCGSAFQALVQCLLSVFPRSCSPYAFDSQT